jgi:hypothetical protein
METETTRDRRRGRTRTTVLCAVGVEVHCPACGEPQPNPEDGSFIWSSSLVRIAAEAGGVRSCTACDTPLRIASSNRVSFQ